MIKISLKPPNRANSKTSKFVSFVTVHPGKRKKIHHRIKSQNRSQLLGKKMNHKSHNLKQLLVKKMNPHKSHNLIKHPCKRNHKNHNLIKHPGKRNHKSHNLIQHPSKRNHKSHNLIHPLNGLKKTKTTKSPLKKMWKRKMMVKCSFLRRLMIRLTRLQWLSETINNWSKLILNILKKKIRKLLPLTRSIILRHPWPKLHFCWALCLRQWQWQWKSHRKLKMNQLRSNHK